MLAASALLLELLTYRQLAATLGREFALFVAMTQPATAALGAMLLARRASVSQSSLLVRSAAHHAALAATCLALGTVGLTWTSQKVAFAKGEGELFHVAVVLVSALAPALFMGSSAGLLMRRGVRRIGRVTFSEAVGGVVACMLLPAISVGGRAPRGGSWRPSSPRSLRSCSATPRSRPNPSWRCCGRRRWRCCRCSPVTSARLGSRSAPTMADAVRVSRSRAGRRRV